MVAFCKVNDISKIGNLCSYVGRQVLLGNVEAVKGIYGNAWKKSAPLLKTITQLQENLTAAEIEKDVKEKYCAEFLYYWGMLCIGELSGLIVKDLGTAEICFKKIDEMVPKAEARLACIKLLQSNDPAKSDCNVERIDTLRRWAGKGDLFSRIILSRIVFFQFLNEAGNDNQELPIRIWRLLEPPCQKGHPVAIRFWNEVLDYSNVGESVAMKMRIDEANINEGVLFDFESVQICK